VKIYPYVIKNKIKILNTEMVEAKPSTQWALRLYGEGKIEVE
jgi:hypothetical protein